VFRDGEDRRPGEAAQIELGQRPPAARARLDRVGTGPRDRAGQCSASSSPLRPPGSLAREGWLASWRASTSTMAWRRRGRVAEVGRAAPEARPGSRIAEAISGAGKGGRKGCVSATRTDREQDSPLQRGGQRPSGRIREVRLFSHRQEAPATASGQRRGNGRSPGRRGASAAATKTTAIPVRSSMGDRLSHRAALGAPRAVVTR
jgi:hypothetical protein